MGWEIESRTHLRYGIDGKTGTGARNLCGAWKSGRKRCGGLLGLTNCFGGENGNGNGKMGM